MELDITKDSYNSVPIIPLTCSSEFANLCQDLSISAAVSQKWSGALITAYTEPQRHYHTVKHIDSMLQSVSLTSERVDDVTAVKLAIFFHDWVYDPTRSDNELRSASVFGAFGKEVDLEVEMCRRVERLIESTVAHEMVVGPGNEEGEAEDEDLKLFLDFDLEVLGRDKVQYKTYSEQIRKEYWHLGEKEFCGGRMDVLKKFLGREVLFLSEWGFENFEERARGNLRAELEELEEQLKKLGES